MEMYQDIQARQIWAEPGHTQPHCEGYRLPPPGVIILNDTVTLTLNELAIFQPACESASSPTATIAANGTLPVYGLGDPFEGSVVPQMFVLGAMLVIAWSLVIMLVITPRTSFVLGTGVGHLGRPAGNSATVISIGGRPWLQKFAALTVGVSLFVATINSFKIIGQQYDNGYQDALAVTHVVVNSYEIRIIRVISTTFVWLAQIQTLIRLFPRHREKVIIKWAGFGLIVLDTLFVILNNFVSHDGNGPKTIRPRGYTEVIPVLSYLFELSLNLLYAAWVIYYSFVKRRFAFFHPQMRNIAVVGLMSYVSVLIPVVFFITDIAKPQIASWGDYIRWVGSAAASVVVWEWVERIEALEREERKNGILGREIFDGDEAFRISPSLKLPRWPKGRPRTGGNDTSSSTTNSRPSDGVSTETERTEPTDTNEGIQLSDVQAPDFPHKTETQGRDGRKKLLLHTSRPPLTESPIPRSETGSAASTVYAVIHHPPSNSASPAQDSSLVMGTQLPPTAQAYTEAEAKSHSIAQNNDLLTQQQQQQASSRYTHILPGIGNPFKRQRSSPPPEVSRAAVDAAGRPSQARWNNRRNPKQMFRLGRPKTLPADLPIVVIPAQPRGQIWTPPMEDVNESLSGGAMQNSEIGTNISVNTPQGLDSSLHESRDSNSNTKYASTDRGDSSSTGHQKVEYISAGHGSAAHMIDRTQSPRSILPRVDEQIESSETRVNDTIESKATPSLPVIPPAG